MTGINVDELRKQQDLEHASNLGVVAYRNGVEWDENPYPIESELDKHKAWIDGWRMERDHWGSK